MVTQPVMKSIHLRNLLSFGDRSEPLELSSLNVLIGPNGSGKSNLIEAIGLLRGAPRDLMVPVREGGGVQEWLWKGSESSPTATITVVLEYPQGIEPLRYRLSFAEEGQRLGVTDERIENEGPKPGGFPPYLYFGYESGYPMLNVNGKKRMLHRVDVNRHLSILSQRKDPDLYPELTYLGGLFESFRLYREWSMGRGAPPRRPQPADLENDFLREDLRNLGLILNKLRRVSAVKKGLLEHLHTFYEEAEDIDISIEGGTVQVFLQERNYTVPATRISDGTLRWICLLAILLDPTPPALVCLEEPELGLHPDMMPTLADLLREAADRMQLIVTTHSDALVDALTDTPEAIIVCEKEGGVTALKRLSSEELKPWLEKYTLGPLWRSGEIGGNRW